MSLDGRSMAAVLLLPALVIGAFVLDSELIGIHHAPQKYKRVITAAAKIKKEVPKAI